MQGATLDLLYAPHSMATAALSSSRAFEDTSRDADLNELRAVERDLTAAQALLADRRHQDAIAAYQALRSRIFGLLSPWRPSRYDLPDHLRPPHDLKHLERMLETSVALVGKGDPVPFRPDPWELLDRDQLGGFDLAAKTGVRVTQEVEDKSAGLARAAAGLAAKGDWRGAAGRYRAAVEVADPSSAMHARLLVNLGAALVQAGDADQAHSTLVSASRALEAVGDSIGRAHAEHNLGILAATLGNADEAKTRFEGADAAATQALGGAGAARGVAAKIGRLETGGIAPIVTQVATDLRSPVTGEGVAQVNLAQRAQRIAPPDSVLAARGAAAQGVAAQAVAITPTNGAAMQFGSGLELVFPEPFDATQWESRPLVTALKSGAGEIGLEAGLVVGTTVAQLKWQAASQPAAADLRRAVYESRLSATSLAELGWSFASIFDVAARLGHLYYYVIAVALGDAYEGAGDWATARTWYRRAVDYTYLNVALEAPVLWQKIAATYLAEGDELYQQEEMQKALDVYTHVLKLDRTTPSAELLYANAKLAPTGTLVAEFMSAPATSPADPGAGVKSVVLDIAHRLVQLAAGLDWFGVPASVVPPFTFPFLQSAASRLAQQAQSAERDYIQFMDHFDTSRLNRLQLAQAANSASLEAKVAREQREAASAEVTLAQDAQAVANKRAQNATADRNAYAAMSSEQVALEAQSTWYGSQNSWELGNPIPGDGRQIHEVLAADRRRLGTINRDYELGRMNRGIGDLALAEAQAKQQVAVSQARLEASQMAELGAIVRAGQAAALVGAFDSSTFTPDVWRNMANFMRQHSSRYLYWATRVARLMERAFEFENDAMVDRIRVDYSSGAIAGLFGSDQLLSDIDYFTYLLITQTKHRTLRATKRLSLAERFPFAFQNAMRRTGRMSFETTLEDIEHEYPGSFGHRIQAVELRVIGLVPRQGIHGTLRSGGVSQYRALDGTVKWRVQDVDTMLLSAYTPADAGQFRPRPEEMGVFEGVGLASTWELEIPAATNDVDFSFIVDVELVFHYEVRFDRELAELVRAQPTPPEQLRASQSASLRWDFPDRFFLYQSTGSATLEFGPELVPHNHVAPKVRSVALQLMGEDGSVPPSAPLTISVPGSAAVTVTPDAAGRVLSSDAALAALAGRPVLGSWSLATAADAAGRAAVYDVLVFVEYDFTERVL